MKTQEVANIFDQYVLGNYKRLPVCIVKGKGSKLWDLEGKEYIDLFPGWAVSNLGHCHPKVVSAIKEQTKKVIHVQNSFLIPKQGQLAKMIVESSFPGKVFFCNSGTESVEAAIKFVRKWGHEKGKFEIISMKGSFHGRTMGSMTATGQERIHGDFQPLPTGFKYGEFNNLDSIKELITDKTAAIILEPVQGEGGIQVATQEFMQGLRKITKEKKLLLIVDEVQTGIAKTGKMFCYQHYGIEPDLMTLAKSLGNGVPIGALVVNNSIGEDVLTPGSHGSTYGGNPLVTAAAVAVFKAVKEEGLIQRAVELSTFLKTHLDKMKSKYSFIKEIRILGLMCGIELSISGVDIVSKCLERRLLINCTQEKILRIIPAATISKKLLAKGLHILDKVLSEAKK